MTGAWRGHILTFVAWRRHSILLRVTRSVLGECVVKVWSHSRSEAGAKVV